MYRHAPPWRSASKKAHYLCHTFASHAVLRGIPLPVVSRLLGHKQPSMTLRYAHVSDRETEAAAGTHWCGHRAGVGWSRRQLIRLTRRARIWATDALQRGQGREVPDNRGWTRGGGLAHNLKVAGSNPAPATTANAANSISWRRYSFIPNRPVAGLGIHWESREMTLQTTSGIFWHCRVCICTIST